MLGKKGFPATAIVIITYDVNVRETGSEGKAREVRDLIDEVFLAHYELVEKKDLNSLKDEEFFYQQKVDEVDTTLAMCVKIDRQNDIAHHDKEVVKRYLTDLFSTIPHGVQLVMFVTIGNFGSQIIEIEH